MQYFKKFSSYIMVWNNLKHKKEAVIKHTDDLIQCILKNYKRKFLDIFFKGLCDCEVQFRKRYDVSSTSYCQKGCALKSMHVFLFIFQHCVTWFAVDRSGAVANSRAASSIASAIASCILLFCNCKFAFIFFHLLRKSFKNMFTSIFISKTWCNIRCCKITLWMLVPNTCTIVKHNIVLFNDTGTTKENVHSLFLNFDIYVTRFKNAFWDF